MNHLDLAYEKLSDLLDELYWAQFRYELTIEKLADESYAKILNKNLKRYEEIAIHLTALMKERRKIYEGFNIPDSYIDQEWSEISEKGDEQRAMLKFCLNQDKVVISQITQLINDGWLPTSLLSSLVSAEFQLKQARKDLKKIRKELKNKSDQVKSKSFLKALRLRF